VGGEGNHYERDVISAAEKGGEVESVVDDGAMISSQEGVARPIEFIPLLSLSSPLRVQLAPISP